MVQGDHPYKAAIVQELQLALASNNLNSIKELAEAKHPSNINNIDKHLC